MVLQILIFATSTVDSTAVTSIYSEVAEDGQPLSLSNEDIESLVEYFEILIAIEAKNNLDS